MREGKVEALLLFFNICLEHLRPAFFDIMIQHIPNGTANTDFEGNKGPIHLLVCYLGKNIHAIYALHICQRTLETASAMFETDEQWLALDIRHIAFV